jgi:cysteine desulfurase
MTDRIYFDYNATAPLRAEVRAAMIEAMDRFGNPSSVHAEGRAARALVESARTQVAALAGCRPEEVIFTSGGSEANALALAAQGGNAWQCYVSAVEHPSVLSGGRFYRESTTRIPVDKDGVIDHDALAKELKKHHLGGWRPFVSVMAANNETGALQPVVQLAEHVRAAEGLLHTDAVQAPGRVPLDFAALGADMLTLSAHKIGGPKGVGALIVRDGVSVEPLIRGGGQERRQRAGTENVIGIVGFGVAADLAREDLQKVSEIESLRDRLEAEALRRVPEAVIFSRGVARLPNTSCIAVAGTKAETLVIGLDLAGVSVSAGSACSSGKVEPSHVLSAMEVSPDLAQAAIRVSLGIGTTDADIERLLTIWSEFIGRVRERPEAALTAA